MQSRRGNLLRFGLRSILILTTIVAAVCGLWLRQVQVQRDVCARLSEAGVEVTLDPPSPWFQWLPESLLSSGDGHYFCSVTEVNLNVRGDSARRDKAHNNDLLAWITQLPRLTHLKIDLAIVDSQDFAHLAKCRRLENLDLNYCELTDDDFARLPRLPHLKTLTLDGNDDLTGKHLNASRLPSVRELYCNYTSIDDSAMTEIGQLSTLRELELRHTRVTDAGIAALSSLKQLESIALANAKVTGAGLGVLRALTKVDLSSTYLTDDVLQEIGKLPGLKFLSMPYCVFVTDEGMKALAHHPSLENIHATGCGISDACTESLATIASLEYLSLEHTYIRSLRKLAACKKLRSLSISSSEVPVDDALQFAEHTNLRIDIEDPNPVDEESSFQTCWCCLGSVETDLTSGVLASMAGRSVGGNRENLVLEGLVGLSAKHFENLHCNIKQLSLARSQLQPDLLPCLKDLPLLDNLDLTKCQLTEADIKAIGELQLLTVLELNSTEFNDRDMLAIESLINLKSLKLGETNITPASLRLLERFTQLESLTIPFVPDTAALIELLKVCPGLTSIQFEARGIEAIEIMNWDGCNLQDNEVTVDQLGELRKLQIARSCEFSNIAGRKLNDEHCAALASFSEVSSVDVSNSQVTDAGIVHLAKLSTLTSLNIAHTNVTGAGLKSLQSHTKLRSLVCAPQSWSVDFVQSLLAMNSLDELYLPFSEMPREAAIALADGSLAYEQFTWIDGGPDFDDSRYYDREDIAWMVGKAAFNSDSEVLSLGGALIDDAKLDEVIGSPALTLVYVDNVACDTEKLLAKLLMCSNVHAIRFKGVSLSPSSIASLAAMKNLNALYLEDCELTSAHIAELASLPRLSTLFIASNQVDIGELSKFAQSNRLLRLTLKPTKPAEEYVELQQQLGKRLELSSTAY